MWQKPIHFFACQTKNLSNHCAASARFKWKPAGGARKSNSLPKSKLELHSNSNLNLNSISNSRIQFRDPQIKRSTCERTEPQPEPELEPERELEYELELEPVPEPVQIMCVLSCRRRLALILRPNFKPKNFKRAPSSSCSNQIWRMATRRRAPSRRPAPTRAAPARPRRVGPVRRRRNGVAASSPVLAPATARTSSSTSRARTRKVSPAPRPTSRHPRLLAAIRRASSRLPPS